MIVLTNECANIYMQTPCGHTFCLKCFQKWIRQGKKTCAECRKNIPAKMASQPRINSAQAYAINRMAMRASSSKGSNNNNNSGAGPSQESHEDLPTANVCSEKIFVIVSSYHFGPITAEHDPERNQGVLVGETWPSTQECKQRGVHFEHIGGIHGESSRGAQSVALSGGYVDDEDHGEWFLYTGRYLHTLFSLVSELSIDIWIYTSIVYLSIQHLSYFSISLLVT